MKSANSPLNVSNYSQKCASCRTLVRRDTLQELQQMFPTTRASYDLDEHYDTHEEFIEAVSSFLEQHDNHKFNLAAQSLRIRAALSDNMFIETDVSMATCAQTGTRALQTRVAMLLRNGIFDNSFTCSRCTEREPERDPPRIQRYRTTFMLPMKYEVYRCAELLSPRKIYQNLIRMAGDSQFEKTDLHTITRQQVYNWERGPANDFLSAQLLIGDQDGYQIVEGLQEPGVSLAFVTPCFSDTVNYDRAKMSEKYVDSTFNANKHGYELYCVLTQYDLVSLPLSTFCWIRVVLGRRARGSRFTAWFTAMLDAGLKPNVVHTDKDFAGA
ncbi:hypothetical protein V1527DRAFT_498314 [Lipomyces starkeyi]